MPEEFQTEGPLSSGVTPVTASAAARRSRWPLHTRILIGLLLGAVLGMAAHTWYAVPRDAAAAGVQDQDGNGIADQLDWFALNVADPIGRVFLRLVLMVVLPLIVSALALAVVEAGRFPQARQHRHQDFVVDVGVLRHRRADRCRGGWRAEAGRTFVAGETKRLIGAVRRGAADTMAKSRQAKSLKDTLLDIIPENPLQEMVGALDGSSKGNGILAVMFFAAFFGAAIARVGGLPRRWCRCWKGSMR